MHICKVYAKVKFYFFKGAMGGDREWRKECEQYRWIAHVCNSPRIFKYYSVLSSYQIIHLLAYNVFFFSGLSKANDYMILGILL